MTQGSLPGVPLREAGHRQDGPLREGRAKGREGASWRVERDVVDTVEV